MSKYSKKDYRKIGIAVTVLAHHANNHNDRTDREIILYE